MENISTLELKLKELRDRYERMTNKGVTYRTKVDTLKKIDALTQDLQQALLTRLHEVERVEKDTNDMRVAHDLTLFSKDSFFNILLAQLNQKEQKFDMVENLYTFDSEEEKRGAWGDPMRGSEYYCYTILGSSRLINQLATTDIKYDGEVWELIANEVVSQGDVIIQSSDYKALELVQHMRGFVQTEFPYMSDFEQSYLRFKDGSLGCYYKGSQQSEIEPLMQLMKSCVSKYGTDFNEVAFQKQIQKRNK